METSNKSGEQVLPWGTYGVPEEVAKVVRRTRGMPANFLGKRLALLLRHGAKRKVKGPLDIEAKGVRMRVRPEDNFCENRLLFMPQFYDVEELEFLRRMLPRDGRFADVGANVGIYSLFVGKHCMPEGRVVSAEPDPETFGRLRENVILNGLEGIVDARQVGIGGEDGVLHLKREGGNRGQNELRAEAEAGTVEVPVLRLAELLKSAGFERLDALKIDIEGMEEAVLGKFFGEAPKSLWPVHILAEDRAGEEVPAVKRLLAEAGYGLGGKTKLNGIWTRREGK